MRGELARTSAWDGESWQVRTEYRPESVCDDHPDTELAKLFCYWQERSLLENGVPEIRDFQPPGRDLPWVDLCADDPLNYVMRNHPAGIAGDWSDTRFGDYPVTIHGVACAHEYLDCKERQYPTYVRIEQRLRDVDRRYARLAVPLADETGAVTRAVYAFRLLRFPVIHGNTDC